MLIDIVILAVGFAVGIELHVLLSKIKTKVEGLLASKVTVETVVKSDVPPTTPAA